MTESFARSHGALQIGAVIALVADYLVWLDRTQIWVQNSLNKNGSVKHSRLVCCSPSAHAHNSGRFTLNIPRPGIAYLCRQCGVFVDRPKFNQVVNIDMVFQSYETIDYKLVAH